MTKASTFCEQSAWLCITSALCEEEPNHVQEGAKTVLLAKPLGIMLYNATNCAGELW